MNLKFLSETLVERFVLNWINKLIRALSFIVMEWVFKFKMKKKWTHFSVTKLNTAPNGVFTYQPKNFDRIFSAEISNLNCVLKQKHSLSLLEHSWWITLKYFPIFEVMNIWYW